MGYEHDGVFRNRYHLTPGGADHLLAILATPDNLSAKASIAVLDKTGSFSKVITNGSSVRWLPTNGDPVYVVVYDTGGTGGYGIALVASDLTLAIQAGGEGDNAANAVYTGAVALMTPPLRVKGASLSDKNDVDWYKVVVPAGKKVRAQTAAGDPNTDTTLQFFSTDGVTPLEATPVDNDFHENVLSPTLPGAGTYYIKVGASSTYQPSATAYDLIVTLE